MVRFLATSPSFADIPCFIIELGLTNALVVSHVNCVTLILSLTIKSPRLLSELSKTRNEFPFTNPCAEEVVIVVTFVELSKLFPDTVTGDPR